MPQDNLEQITRTFFLIDENWDLLWKRTANDGERKQLVSARDASRDTFWRATAEKLEDNHKMVIDLRNSLKEANDHLKQMIDSMESFTKTIKGITQAVTLAAALVTLAAI
jgi:uncharacterized protein (DUF2342 family)